MMPPGGKRSDTRSEAQRQADFNATIGQAALDSLARGTLADLAENRAAMAPRPGAQAQAQAQVTTRGDA